MLGWLIIIMNLSIIFVMIYDLACHGLAVKNTAVDFTKLFLTH